MFQASLFKMSFTKIILIYFFVISTLSTQTLIWSQIDLGFHCFYLEITWKIYGILCHKRSGNPASVLTHFAIFLTKNLYESTWNLAQKTWNLGPRTLRKPGIWEKVGTLVEEIIIINSIKVVKVVKYPERFWGQQKHWTRDGPIIG